MKEDLRLNEIRDLLLKANEIDNFELRVEMQKVVWSTLIFYLSGHYRKISGEERIFRDALEKFG